MPTTFLSAFVSCRTTVWLPPLPQLISGPCNSWIFRSIRLAGSLKKKRTVFSSLRWAETLVLVNPFSKPGSTVKAQPLLISGRRLVRRRKGQISRTSRPEARQPPESSRDDLDAVEAAAHLHEAVAFGSQNQPGDPFFSLRLWFQEVNEWLKLDDEAVMFISRPGFEPGVMNSRFTHSQSWQLWYIRWNFSWLETDLLEVFPFEVTVFELLRKWAHHSEASRCLKSGSGQIMMSAG